MSDAEYFAHVRKIEKARVEGYLGILQPKGELVDRREYPDAMPVPANSYMGIPEPKEVNQDD